MLDKDHLIFIVRKRFIYITFSSTGGPYIIRIWNLLCEICLKLKLHEWNWANVNSTTTQPHWSRNWIIALLETMLLEFALFGDHQKHVHICLRCLDADSRYRLRLARDSLSLYLHQNLLENWVSKQSFFVLILTTAQKNFFLGIKLFCFSR